MRHPCKRWLSVTALLGSLIFAAPAFAPDPPLQALAPFEVLIDGLKSPTYLATDSDDQLLLSEADSGQILQIAPDRTVSVLIDQIEDPAGLALDPTGTLFFAAHRQRGTAGKGQDGVILRRDPPTRRLTVLANNFQQPKGLALDHTGNLILSAEGRAGDKNARGSLFAISATGGISLSVQGFKQPQGILAAPDGSVIVAAEQFERGNAKVDGSLFKVDSTGQITAVISHPLKDPFGVVRDPLDSLYVAGTQPSGPGPEHGVILKRRPDGQIVTFAQMLRKPRGMAFDTKGNLYLVEAEQKRVLKFLAPSPPIVNPPPPDFTNQATLVLHGTTEPGALLTVQGGSTPLTTDGSALVTGFADATGAFALSVPLAKNQTNTLQLFATGASGNGLTSAPTSITVIHDDLPPTVSITTPAASAVLRGTVPFTAAASDSNGIGLVTLQADGVTLSATNAPPFTTSLDTTTLPDGSHTLSAIARDKAGNEATASILITTDNTPPILAITDPADVSTVSTPTPTITIAYSDATSGIAVGSFHATLDGSDITTAFTLSSTGATATLATSLASGSHTLQASIVDQASNAATAASAFTVATGPDFTLSAAPETATVLAGDQVSYRIMADSSQGFSGSIALSLSGAPAGVTVLLSPPQIAPGGVGATLTVAVASSVTISSFTLTLTGSATVNGQLASRTLSLPITVLPSTTTAFVGRVLNATDEPLQNVQITLLDQSNRATSMTATTDAGGNFLLLNVPVGNQMFFVDGRQAKASTSDTRQYPPVETVLTIVANQPNRVPFTIYLPAIDTTAMTQTPPSNPTPIMATSPHIPDLQVEIPANTTITLTEPDGTTRTITEITLTAVPVDKAPMPLPLGASPPFLLTIQPGGAVPQNTQGGVIVRFPTFGKGIPGGRADLVFFDFTVRAWRVYGQGTVSADGRQVIPDPGVVQPRFAWGFCVYTPPPQVNPNLTSQPTAPGGTKGGEPVDLATGTFTLGKTDLVLPSRLPIVLTRTYRSGDTLSGPFGIGGRHQYDAFLVFPTSTATDQLVLVLPDLTRHAFARQPDGTFRNTTDPAMQGVVARQGVVTFKDQTVWTFDAGGRLISQQDRNGNTVTITRDGQGRVTSLTDPAARQFSFTYSGTTLQITQVTDPLGRAVRYAYDAASRLTSVTDAAGGVTSYTYDASSRLSSITDPRSLTFLTNTYDAQGRVCRQTQADGGIWLFYYIAADAATTSEAQQLLTQAAAGGPISQPPCTVFGTAATVLSTVVVDPQGHPTTSRFNANGYLIAQTDALGQQTSFERALGTNLLLSSTDPLGRKTAFSYDANGNVTSITDPAGNVRAFTYEPTFNKLTRLTDPVGHVTTFAYDAKGNLSSMTDPLGSTTTITSNPFGQPIATTDPLGNTTRFDYDAFGNLTTITDPLGHATTRTYDLVSRLLTQTDPKGKRTTFAYDALNRLTQLVDALSGVTRFTYDGNGNLLTVTDALNHSMTHTYDSMDRLARRTDPLLGRVETFNYDGNGNLVSTTDRKGQTTTFSYDALNRRVKSTFADGTIASFTYDAAGRLVQADDGADPHRPIMLAYDTLDRLVNETTALGTVAYQYDPLGRRTQMAVNDLSPVSYAYDAASRLRTITQAPLNPVSIDYDALGRRTTLTLPNGVSTESQYDAASRLTALIYRNAAGILGDLSYTYDATGNRTGVGGSFARTLLPDPIASATYDAANRQLTFGDKAMTYDGNGNLTSITDSSGTTTFTWDARNRLAGLHDPSVTAAFGYDAFGRRAAKTVNGQPIQYLYDGADIVRQSDSLGTTSYLRSLNIDEALSFTNRDGTFFSTHDSLGSTVAVTDSAATSLAQYTYDPFGTTSSTNPTLPNLFQYTSREHDLPGFYYYRARYYSPLLHRFLTQDPIGLIGGDPNLYAYVLNNPLKFNDPTGELAAQLIGLGVGALGGGISALVNNENVFVGAGIGAAEGLAASFGGPGIAVLANSIGNVVGQLASGKADFNLTSVGLAAAAALTGKGLGAALVRAEVPGPLAQITTGLAFTPNAAGISAVLGQVFRFRVSDLVGQFIGGRK